MALLRAGLDNLGGRIAGAWIDIRTATLAVYPVRNVSVRARRHVQPPMLSQAEQATLNVEQARSLRASGKSYREIGRQLGLTSGQLGHVRRTLKREKAARTRLRSTKPEATDRDLPVGQSVLPPGLRRRLTASGLRTLGDLADRLADPDFPGLETMPGIGRHRAQLVTRLLDHFCMLPGPSDLQAAIEDLFPEFGDEPPIE